jgi:DNA-binding response OmpR family regulator
MFSALGKEEDMVKSREAGACDYLSKPFDKETLLKKIKPILDRLHASSYQSIN